MNFLFFFSYFMAFSMLGIFKSPLMMALLLIYYALIIGITAWFMLSKWAMMAIFLIFLGGMMIVFLYAVTISPNYVDSPQFGNSTSIIILCGLLTVFSQFYVLIFKQNFDYSFMAEGYTNLNSLNLFILTFYLLIILFLIIKSTEGFKGAIVKTF